jgi:hypothetical protein
MKIRTAFLVPLLALVAVACSATSSSTSPALPNGERIGAEVRPQTPVRFAVVDATPKQYFDKTLLVEANVKAVCQKMGCWMQVEDEGHTAMVRWESGCGGKYAFPKDAAGKRVLIQGSFYPKHIDEADAKHMEEEAGHKLSIAREGYEFNASSVIILDAQ